MPWQLQQARQRFGALVQQALDEGPQVVTRCGEEVVVVLSMREYRELAGAAPDFNNFLLAAPDLDRLAIERPGELTRIVEL